MANYDDLKKKAKETLETIADVSVEAYKVAEEKAKVIAKRTKLNAEIAREKGLIRHLKSDIGNKYYKMHKDDPEEALKKDCDSITDAIARIEANKKEIDELKKGGVCCECDADADNDAEEECCKDDAECCTDAESESAPEEGPENPGE